MVTAVTSSGNGLPYGSNHQARMSRAPDQKETTMRTVTAISTILAILSFTVASANAGTWCAHYGRSGGTNCGFHSFEQCQAAVSGTGGFCTGG
jgi:hypothetical protein